MKIVVTGAAGHLGSHLIPLFVDKDFDVIGIDVVAARTKQDYDFRQLSLTERDRLPSILDGADLVVHTASIHPWKEYRDEEYLDSNIKGTWQLFSAIEEVGIRNVVLTSSIAAVGYHEIPTSSWPVTEEDQFPIGDLYSLTKHTQEQIARHYAFLSPIRTFAIRPPAFMPKPELETGFLLTANFCVVEDIAQAHLLAAEAMLDSDSGKSGLFEAFFAVNSLPYVPSDASLLMSPRDVSPLVEKYWPAEHQWIKDHGYRGVSIAALYDIAKAERIFGWRPQYNFSQWAEEHTK